MPGRRLFLVAYAASGAAGLLYEVAWARLLTLHVGHSTAAVSTVLAAFMGGLAAGAALGGRYAPRMAGLRALRAYAMLEVAVAGCALLLPLALAAAQPILLWAYDPAQAGGPLFAVARVATSVAILAVPAALMGATFPFAVRWYVRTAALAGRETGTLYAVNTVGAAAGAALTGFVLLPALGLRATAFVGVALNVAAAAIAWWIARGGAQLAPEAPEPVQRPRQPAKRRPDAAPPALDSRRWLAIAALALSGFVALTYEVAWTRVLALVVGPTTYAFALMLAAFICGLAIGAAFGARWATRRDPLAALALTLLVTAFGGLLVAGTASELPLRVARMVARPDVTFLSVLAAEAGTLVALLLPATFALGAAFPLAIAAATGPSRPVARDAALVYAGNTLGAIGGSLVSGFLLVPWLGLRTTIIFSALAAASGGAAVAWLGRSSRGARGLALALTAAAAGTVVILPAWNRALLSSGAYKYAPYLQDTDLETALEAGTLLYYAEGAAGTVTVRRAAGELSLAIDGKVDASNSGDMLTQKLLAHLPLLLHPAPREVAIVGLGSGVTAGAALRHPVDRVDVIEISPEVIEASAFFAKENLDALRDPRLRLLRGDARAHLGLGRQRYDVIISEPSNPWMAGVASLFTREFFQTLRNRLAPGGILCQWAHTYDISGEDLRSITQTFLTVFPSGSLWLIGEADVLLIAGAPTSEVQLDRITGAWHRPGVAEDLARVGVAAPFALLSQFVASGPALQAFTGTAPVQTDDRMALEFSAPRGIVGPAREDNAALLWGLASRSPVPAAVQQARDGASPADWKHYGQMLLRAEAYRTSYEALARAAELDPGDLETLEALERTAAQAHRLDQLLALLSRLSQEPAGRVTARVAASRILASAGRSDEALKAVDEALAAGGNDPRALLQQASILADLGDPARLDPVVRRLQSVAAQEPDTQYYRATLALLNGQPAEAILLAEQLLRTDPAHARAQTLIGVAQANLGNVDAARRAFLASLDVSPREPTTYLNLGLLELQNANAAAAAGYFAEALTLDPSSAAAREGLARALELRGDRERARRLRETPRG